MAHKIKEELKRIHRLNYGPQFLEEKDGKNIFQKLLDKIKGKNKIDDPRKADIVSNDVQEFFDLLETTANSGGITQQTGGGYTYQASVEAMQIGLLLLGYELPRFGVDGLFGPETAQAVKKFKEENLKTDKILAEEINNLIDKFFVAEAIEFVKGTNLIGRPGQGTHSASGWENNNAWDVAAPVGAEVKSLTNGVVKLNRKASGGLKIQGVKKIYGDQVVIKSSNGPDVFYTHIDSIVSKGQEVKVGDVIGTIMQVSGIPSHVHVALSSGNLSDLASNLPNATGGRKVSGTGTSSDVKGVIADKETLYKLIELLKEKNIKSEDIKKYTDKSYSGVVNKIDIQDFKTVSDTIIDKFEGGYYNPQTHFSPEMGRSGETMMGMDRKAGGDTTNTGRMTEFWKLIDTSNKERWPRYYMGGPLEKRLREIVSEVMRGVFARNCQQFLTEEARNIVLSNKGLFFNFAYATWNGPGFFRDWAKVINEQVKNGQTDPTELLKIAVNLRKQHPNSVIQKTGKKMGQMFNV